MKISIKLPVFYRLFELSHGARGGEAEHRGADEEGGGLGHSGVGATAHWRGWGHSGGVNSVNSLPLRTALHTISISLQNLLS